MKIQITLDIPEESVYAGVVSDALEKIAPYWDEGARGGDLECEAGPVSWDSDKPAPVTVSEPKLLRLVTLLSSYGMAKFGDEWWPGNAAGWLNTERAQELAELLDFADEFERGTR